MRISDWSSDVCSSDLAGRIDHRVQPAEGVAGLFDHALDRAQAGDAVGVGDGLAAGRADFLGDLLGRARGTFVLALQAAAQVVRSEEHTSELQSLMRISYAVFCLKKKKKIKIELNNVNTTHMTS